MNRFVATIVLGAALALPAAAAQFDNIILHDRNWSYISNASDIAKSLNLSGRYAYFEKDGVGYVITDGATIDRLHAAVRPQIDIGNRQSVLGQEQARLGQEQARIGMRQAEIGLRQASNARNGARLRELDEEQRAMSEEQRKLGEKQKQLGAKQQALGEQQRIAGEQVRRELGRLFDQAISQGVAQRRR
ncbi:MAG TPA: hypothetical protein VF824_14345 [Thermoanaerobaculia bacterium]|jgi:hypothetical protein